MTELATLLPANATPYEKAQSLTSAARRPLPADLIKTVWNPDTCPEALLTHLANTLSVDVWDESWDAEKKRRVIRRAIPVQKIKGTLAALREYAGYRGAEIVSVARPPQRFFASSSITPAEREAWIASLPQIRLYVQGATATRRPLIVAGGGAKPYFLTRRFAYPTTAPARAGDRAVIWRAGVETAIGTGSWDGTSEVTISVLGERLARLHAGRAVGAYPSPSVATDHIYRIVLDESADLTPVAPGSRLQTTRTETVSAVSYGRRQWRAGAIALHRYARPSIAATQIYRRIPIIDDSVAAEPRKSVSFASVTRLRVPAHTADLGVDIPGKGSRVGIYAAVRCAGLHAMPSVARSRIQPTFEALAAGKRFSDTIYVNTNVHRPLTAGSSLFAGTTYRAGEWTRA